MLASRYVTFYKSLLNSSMFPVRFIARLKEQDRRSVLGKTLKNILEECDLRRGSLEILCANLVKEKLKYFRVPGTEEWRLPILSELLKIREKKLELNNFEPNEVEEMITDLCIS